MDSHRRHHSACENIDPDVVDYRVFARNTAERASTGTLKQPRLPGTEKFRFSQTFSSRPISVSTQRRSEELLPSKVARTSKRRPILPISKNTSQVLNNTNAELSADTIDFIRNETSHLTSICKRYVNECNNRDEEIQSDGWSCSSSDQSVEGNPLNCTSKSGSDCTDPFEDRASPDMSQEMNNNSNKPVFASIRSNRLRMRTASNKLNSTSTNGSVDDDIWILREELNQ